MAAIIFVAIVGLTFIILTGWLYSENLKLKAEIADRIEEYNRACKTYVRFMNMETERANKAITKMGEYRRQLAKYPERDLKTGRYIKKAK